MKIKLLIFQMILIPLDYNEYTDEIFVNFLFSHIVLDRRCKYRKYLQARRAG